MARFVEGILVWSSSISSQAILRSVSWACATLNKAPGQSDAVVAPPGGPKVGWPHVTVQCVPEGREPGLALYSGRNKLPPRPKLAGKARALNHMKVLAFNRGPHSPHPVPSSSGLLHSVFLNSIINQSTQLQHIQQQTRPYPRHIPTEYLI